MINFLALGCNRGEQRTKTHQILKYLCMKCDVCMLHVLLKFVYYLKKKWKWPHPLKNHCGSFSGTRFTTDRVQLWSHFRVFMRIIRFDFWFVTTALCYLCSLGEYTRVSSFWFIHLTILLKTGSVIMKFGSFLCSFPSVIYLKVQSRTVFIKFSS